MNRRDGDEDPDLGEERAIEVASKALPYPASRLAPRFDLVNLAEEIERADATISLVANSKLEAIAAQMRALREQARDVLEEARRASELHRARCNFPKRPGSIYHLYRREDGDRYFSMLSPADWSGHPPHEYEGSYRLELDMSWTEVD